MKQELLKDVVVVFFIWFVVCYAFSGFPLTYIPSVALGVLLIWTIGIAGGIAAALAVRDWVGNVAQRQIDEAVVGSASAEATIMDGDEDKTLYQVPLPFSPEPKYATKGSGVFPWSRKTSPSNPVHKLPWWPKYAQMHPTFAAVIDQAYDVMEARPGLPAGVDKHQGVKLVEHSINVMETLLTIAPTWKFDGVKNTKGKIIAPLLSGDGQPHTFGDGSPFTNPILPVAAFAHDIGKVKCLVMEGKKAKAMLPGHGEKGAAILRSMPTVIALKMEDRDALLMAVKYYHHLSDMPLATWITDGMRSLTALLYLADCQSAFNKGRGRPEDDEAASIYAAEKAPPVPAGTPAPEAVAETEEMDIDAAPTTAGPETAPEVGAEATPAVEEDYVLDSGATPLDVLVDLIESPDAVNSKSKPRRLGWKHGEWTFIQLDSLTRAAAKLADDKGILLDGAKGRFIQTLLRQLGAKGWLYVGEGRNPEGSIWNVISSRTEASSDTANSYDAIVIRSEASVRLAATADCPASPRILDQDSGWVQPAESPAGQAEEAKAAAKAEQAESALDELDAIMNGFVPPADSSGDVTKVRGSVAPATKPTLSSGVLIALAQENAAGYGILVRKKPDGTKYACFDVDSLDASFSWDKDNVPEGLRYVEASQKMWVRLP